MVFVVETGIGLETANSFITVEFCDGYCSSQIDGQEWMDEDLEDKKIAIVSATTILNNSYDFDGRRLTRLQALEFPRWGLRDRSNYLIPTAPLPRDLMCATAELARILRTRAGKGMSSSGSSTSATSGGAVEKIQVGPISLSLSSAATTSGGSGSAATAAAEPLIPRSVTGWLYNLGTPRFGYGSGRLVR